MDRPIGPKSENVDLTFEPSFDLGGGRVDPQALQYATATKAFRLQPQTMKVLVALHDRTGQVVTRDELIERCWNGRIVGDDVINRAISLLRPLASASGRFTIETIVRSGYRLIEQPDAPRRRIASWRAACILLLPIAIVGAALILTHQTPAKTGRNLVVAVMPFTTQPGGGTDRFAADVQDSVVRMLSESGLVVRVVGHGSAADGADLLLSGTVNAGQQGAVATFRLEDLARHVVVLSHRLESDPAHVADLPDRVGANLASALSWTGPLILLDARQPSDPAFLIQLLDAQGSPEYDGLAAFEFARRNAPNAPNSAFAQFTLAIDTSFALLAIPREQRVGAVAAALRAADRARQLAPEFGDVYIPWCLLHSPTLMRACEDGLRTGLARDAQSTWVTFNLSQLMNNVGRTDDAASLANASLAEDRYVSNKLGLVIELDEAVGGRGADTVYNEAARLWPNDFSFFWRRAEGMLQRGDFQALEKFERQVGKKNFPTDYNSGAAAGNALSAHSPDALAAACPKNAQGIQAIQCMIAASLMGDVDDAFVFAATLYPRIHAQTPAQSDAIWLNYPYEQDTAYLTSPATAAMRRDPRFLALADGVGLLDYWRSGRLPDFCTKAHEAVCSRIVRQAL